MNNTHKQFFLLNYGFYDTSSLSVYITNFSLDKNDFNFQKYNICKKTNCVEDMDIDYFYQNQNLSSIVLDFKVNSKKLNRNMLDLMRLIAIPHNDVIDVDYVVSRLSDHKNISYRNDMLAYLMYKDRILDTNVMNSHFGYTEVVRVLMVSRKYYRMNRVRIDSSIRLSFKYKLRSNIFRIILDIKRILFRNLQLVNKKMQRQASLQILRIKDHYMNQNDD